MTVSPVFHRERRLEQIGTASKGDSAIVTDRAIEITGTRRIGRPARSARNLAYRPFCGRSGVIL
jgi:hypothetical protein